MAKLKQKKSKERKIELTPVSIFFLNTPNPSTVYTQQNVNVIIQVVQP